MSTGPTSDELDAWIVELATALELDPGVVDRDLLLDLAREAAHGVARPAAPLTTFLVGLAAGVHGADRAAIEKVATTVAKLLAER